MNLLRLYYFASVPILTCNLLFYSISTLSTSITSSQNVVRFIYEHKDCDSINFKKELEQIDLENKIRIIESLIFEIIKKYCNSKEDYDDFKKIINNPSIVSENQDETKQFVLIELKNDLNIFYKIEEPLRLALLSTFETIQIIKDIISKIHQKIKNHSEFYLNKFMTLNLQIEISDFKKNINLLEKRYEILLNLLKIYLPLNR